MSSLRVVDVALDPRSGGTNAIYTYLPTPKTSVGDAVLVSLGNRQVLGYAIGFRDVTPEILGFDPVHLKPVVGIVSGLQIPSPIMAADEAQLTIAPWLSRRCGIAAWLRNHGALRLMAMVWR